MELRIAGITRESVVDGPGIRLVVFVQGCPHHCPGCHNPETHDPLGGKLIDTTEILNLIDTSLHIRGLTFSGGEPFLQAFRNIVRCSIRFFLHGFCRAMDERKEDL